MTQLDPIPVDICADCGASSWFCQCFGYEAERESSHLATPAEADREYAYNVGMDNPDRAWILSDRDAWYANPYYCGPAVPHPEDDSEYEFQEAMIEQQDAMEARGGAAVPYVRPLDDEIPF